jgi:hypothetical protein
LQSGGASASGELHRLGVEKSAFIVQVPLVHVT